jgi:hypothetical protein
MSKNPWNILSTVIPELQESYDYYISRGLDEAKKYNISFIGLVRDQEDSLLEAYTHLSKLKPIFKNLNFILYENDSKDNTKKILENIQNQDSNFYFVSENFKEKKYGQVKDKNRTLALAKYRNYLKEILKQKIEKKIIQSDFVVVIDWDFKDYSINGFLHSIGYLSENTEISAVAGNSYQLKEMPNKQKIVWNYDCWAFRMNYWSDYGLFSEGGRNLDYWFGLWTPPIGSKPILVNSAFGGSCIYRTNFYLQGNYEGYDCEHVCFHKYLSSKFDNFKLVLNPSQITIFD